MKVKAIVFSILLLLGAAAAYAATLGGPVDGRSNGPALQRTESLFTNWTGHASTETFSPNVYDVRGWHNVTLNWEAVTALGNYTTAFANTVKVYVGQSPTGPWTPVNIGTTPLSFTANGSVSFPNPGPYVTISQTRVRNGLTCWITVSNNQ